MDEFPVIEKLPLKILEGRTPLINHVGKVIANVRSLAQSLPHSLLPVRADYVGPLGVQQGSHLDTLYVLNLRGGAHQHGRGRLIMFQLERNIIRRGRNESKLTKRTYEGVTLWSMRNVITALVRITPSDTGGDGGIGKFPLKGMVQIPLIDLRDIILRKEGR